MAVVMLAAGVLFTLQGLGYVTGSAMTGERFWATVGPVIAGFGIALAIVTLQKR